MRAALWFWFRWNGDVIVVTDRYKTLILVLLAGIAVCAVSVILLLAARRDRS